MNILNIKNLEVIYKRGKQETRALNGISLAVKAGSNHAIVGESGSGKSTLALAVLNLIMPFEGRITSGEIFFENDIDLLKLDKNKLRNIRGKEISLVFQDPFSTLNPVMTVRRQLHEAILAHNQINERNLKGICENILDDVLLTDYERILGSYPHELSGGQRQRIALAMAIANKPKLLLADEPTTALDVTIQKEIMDLIDKLKSEHNLTVVLITHNLALAFERSGHISVMYNGEIVESAPKMNIFEKPLHPYTKELLNSVPGIRRKHAAEKKAAIPVPADTQNLCRFLNRCPERMKKCLIENPKQTKIGQRTVKCWLYQEK